MIHAQRRDLDGFTSQAACGKKVGFDSVVHPKAWDQVPSIDRCPECDFSELVRGKTQHPTPEEIGKYRRLHTEMVLLIRRHGLASKDFEFDSEFFLRCLKALEEKQSLVELQGECLREIEGALERPHPGKTCSEENCDPYAHAGEDRIVDKVKAILERAFGKRTP